MTTQLTTHSPEFKFKCGHRVRSIMMNETGLITSRMFHLSGCVQYYVMFPKEPGQIAALHDIFDEQELRFVDDGISSEATPAVEENPFPLGSNATDFTTKMSGVLRARSESFNGCVQYLLRAPQVAGKDTESWSEWAQAPYLVLDTANPSAIPAEKSNRTGPGAMRGTMSAPTKPR